MSLYKIKSFIAIFVMFTYISISIFGLFQFNHSLGMAMADCPYAQGSFSVCDSNLEHINYWHQFSNTTFASFFILGFLILGIILYVLNTQVFFDIHFYKWKYYLNTKSHAYSEKITRWLSLFENSPPVLISFNL